VRDIENQLPEFDDSNEMTPLLGGEESG